MLKRLFGRLFATSATEEPRRAGILSGEVAQMSPADVGRALGSCDLITGMTFFATHQLRTPLRILQRNGEAHLDMHTPPPAIAEELWQGIWLPRTRTWRDLGVNMDEFSPTTVASDAGPVISDEYLPFLVAVRKIVEQQTSIEARREGLRTELRRECWSHFCSALDGEETVLDQLFTPFVSTLPGLSQVTISTLKRLGLTTPAAISAAGDAELLAIEGVGPVRLRNIRVACAAAPDQHDAFLDRVLR